MNDMFAYEIFSHLFRIEDVFAFSMTCKNFRNAAADRMRWLDKMSNILSEFEQSAGYLRNEIKWIPGGRHRSYSFGKRVTILKDSVPGTRARYEREGRCFTMWREEPMVWPKMMWRIEFP
jgi:hypothetical protein